MPITVVCEGVDGSGKTTLIERARENQTSRYFLRIQASRYQPSVKDALQYLNWLRHGPNIDIILDRFHFISDRVYGPVIRNEDVFKEYPINFGLVSLGAVIYCRPPRNAIHENVSKNPQMAGVLEHLDTLIDRYDTLMQRLQTEYNIPVWRYDYQTDDPVGFWRFVFSEAHKIQILRLRESKHV